MRVAILSFWNSNDNYGQLLQCFAMQRHYQQQGHEVVHIRYDFSDKSARKLKLEKILNPVVVVRKMKSIMKKKKQMINREKENREFDIFREKFLSWTDEYHGYDELRQSPPEADMYVVGSDQVWNFYKSNCEDVVNQIHAVFLDFGDKNVIRRSYAASWGGMKLNKKFVSEITPLLASFDDVTVREKTGIDNCKLCGRTDARWVCDPTLLLDASEYRKLYQMDNISNNSKKNKPYIFLYYVDNGGTFKIKTVYEWAKKRELEIVYVGGNGNYDKYKKKAATIPQWLYLIDNAEYVVTNSFHCSVFSYLFKKKFGVIPITGMNSGMNERFDSLFEYLNIKPRIITGIRWNVLENEVEW